MIKEIVPFVTSDETKVIHTGIIMTPAVFLIKLTIVCLLFTVYVSVLVANTACYT